MSASVFADSLQVPTPSLRLITPPTMLGGRPSIGPVITMRSSWASASVSDFLRDKLVLLGSRRFRGICSGLRWGNPS